MQRTKKNFRTCVLTSGLVTPAELDQAIVALWTERSGGGAAQQVEIAEKELADRLVDLGKLTPWQAGRLLAGQTKFNLSQYRLLESVGRGGMGEVFKAEHTFMGRIVAVKILPLNKATPEAVASFIHEIRVQGKLHHENLVQVFDAGKDTYHFLVTEFVPGMDLRKYVRLHGPLDMRSAATIISQAAKGLGHAHEQGLIHRDVKPGNLLVTPEGKTKVSDLGLAGWVDESKNDPRAGKIVGTADYLSPEQILTPRQVTPASDIYSLGCTLYYAVTGKVPFTGGNTRDKARRHLEDMPLHPRRLNPDLSEKMVDIIAEMMNKKVEDRVKSSAEVVRRLAPGRTSAWRRRKWIASNSAIRSFFPRCWLRRMTPTEARNSSRCPRPTCSSKKASARHQPPPIRSRQFLRIRYRHNQTLGSRRREAECRIRRWCCTWPRHLQWAHC